MNINILEAPTEKLIKSRTEELLGIQITGWFGKYFSSLDSTNKQIPRKFINNYLNNNSGSWPFKNAGIIIANNQGGTIVLESGSNLNTEKPFIFTDESNCKKYNIPDHIDYPNWFEIINTNDTIETVAKYQINVTSQGEELLKNNNLHSTFPAIIVCQRNGLNSYYFAGNFANNNVVTLFARLANSRKITRKISVNDSRVFFLDFYFPLMESILNGYILSKSKTIK